MPGHVVARAQEESKGARQIAVNEPEGLVVDLGGIGGHLADVATNEGQGSLVGIEPSQAANALKGLVVVDVAADSVHRIGRIDDDASRLQGFRDLADLAAFGIVGVDLKQHSLVER